jgi:hypothetical protein
MRLNAIAAVLALNLALAGALAYLWSDEERSRWAEPAALPPSLEDVAAAPASEPVDVSRYRETVERPLFVATRRPGPRKDPAAEAEAAIDTLKDVRLLGTYGAGERGGIIVVNGGKVQRLAVGETIGGWKVASGGEGRSAELVRASGERRRLDLALNSVAPAVPGAAKAGGAEAAQAAAVEPAQASSAAPVATSQRGAAARSGGRSAGGGWGEEARRRRQERFNERRAAQGQPPPQETK